MLGKERDMEIRSENGGLGHPEQITIIPFWLRTSA